CPAAMKVGSGQKQNQVLAIASQTYVWPPATAEAGSSDARGHHEATKDTKLLMITKDGFVIWKQTLWTLCPLWLMISRCSFAAPLTPAKAGAPMVRLPRSYVVRINSDLPYAPTLLPSTPRRSPTLVKAAMAWSMCSSVCAAETCTRMRA